MMQVKQILSELHKLADPEKVSYKEKKFGVISHNALGIYHQDLKLLAKTIPKDAKLAEQLFDSGIYEARLLCSKIFPLAELSEDLMEKWVVTFENWEICDSFCMGLFAKSEFAIAKIFTWCEREAEFEKRSAFATIASYCMADKHAANKVFQKFFPLIKQACMDERLYVKKAVNWALRSIGKRNPDLREKAILCSKQILQKDSKSDQWIASNALKELENPKLRLSNYPRNVYQPFQ
ncbi:MAG: DNA alkylation repair protein [Spirochaetota bacterium]